MIRKWKKGAQKTSPFSESLEYWDTRRKQKSTYPYHMVIIWHIVVTSTMIEGCISSLRNNLDNRYQPVYEQIEGDQVVTSKVPWNDMGFLGNIFGRAHLHASKAIFTQYKALFGDVKWRNTFQIADKIIAGHVMLDFMRTFEHYGVSPSTKQAHEHVKNWNNEK